MGGWGGGLFFTQIFLLLFQIIDYTALFHIIRRSRQCIRLSFHLRTSIVLLSTRVRGARIGGGVLGLREGTRIGGGALGLRRSPRMGGDAMIYR